jgi:hypothetical protein
VARSAEPYRPLFERYGFPKTTIEDLLAAANRLEATITKREEVKRARTVATDCVPADISRGLSAIRQLGAAIRFKLGKDVAFMAAWRSATRVKAPR